MTIQIPLSTEAEATLRERAAAAGQDVVAFVLEAVNDKLAFADQRQPEIPASDHSAWTAALRAWGESHPRRDSLADDSREQIYVGRGE